jgi:hypothetical protein
MKDRKDKLKRLPDHAETQSLDEQVLDVASGDTQRMPTLTIEELERCLKDKKPAP